MRYNQVTLLSRDIKSMARQMMAGHYLEGVGMMLIVAIISEGPSILLTNLANTSDIVAILLMLYGILVSGPLNLGAAGYFLDMFRNRPRGKNYRIFEGTNLREALKLYIFVTLRVLLKSLLLVIPGIIESIRLSMVYYIMADDPSKDALQCIQESVIMMEGNKLAFFRLALSFAGWYILSGIPKAILVNHFAPGPFSTLDEQFLAVNAASSRPIVMIAGFLTVLCEAYFMIAGACFHDLVTGKIIIENDYIEDIGL